MVCMQKSLFGLLLERIGPLYETPRQKMIKNHQNIKMEAKPLLWGVTRLEY